MYCKFVIYLSKLNEKKNRGNTAPSGAFSYLLKRDEASVSRARACASVFNSLNSTRQS